MYYLKQLVMGILIFFGGYGIGRVVQDYGYGRYLDWLRIERTQPQPTEEFGPPCVRPPVKINKK